MQLIYKYLLVLNGVTSTFINCIDENIAEICRVRRDKGCKAELL